MNISEITSGVSSGVAKAGETIKNAAIWTGRQIAAGFSKLGELIKSAWNAAFPFIKTAATKTLDFLRTAPGMGIIGITAGAVLTYTACELKNNKMVATAFHICAITCFVGAGVAIGLGVANGFTTPLF